MNIRQIIPIEKGWKWWYLHCANGDPENSQAFFTAIVGQALVETANGTEVVFLVFDGRFNCVRPEGEIRERCENSDNCAFVSITPPNVCFSDDHRYDEALARLKKKFDAQAKQAHSASGQNTEVA